MRGVEDPARDGVTGVFLANGRRHRAGHFLRLVFFVFRWPAGADRPLAGVLPTAGPGCTGAGGLDDHAISFFLFLLFLLGIIRLSLTPELAKPAAPVLTAYPQQTASASQSNGADPLAKHVRATCGCMPDRAGVENNRDLHIAALEVEAAKPSTLVHARRGCLGIDVTGQCDAPGLPSVRLVESGSFCSRRTSLAPAWA